MKTKKKKLLSTFFKIGVTVLLLYIIFTKIPFDEVWSTIKKSNTLYLSLAILCFILSQWISAKRLLVLFKAVHFYLSARSNYILYLIGMFYNFFIPGGIGGDAYKVYILNKKFKWSIKKLSAAVLLDRFIGLTAIGILLIILLACVPLVIKLNLIWAAPFVLILGVLGSYLFTKQMFPSFLSVYPKTLLLSVCIQLLQCICLVFIVKSISPVETDQYITYVIVFLISSVLSVFSFSGIGVREMIFYQASSLFIFNSTTAVTIGVLFSIITAFISLFGFIFHVKKPELKCINTNYITSLTRFVQ
ncbi:lysylphosphatidylglycerol synthase transmembrane domain-containing protein [Aquimarina muelleri]|nr:lysylphosphatidylglycerol synthase transmembrane domain-containing protein [Aquimarina muelleri]MCX2761597.1 flippase-like domain-containing protein [Aquimarina muelleri]